MNLELLRRLSDAFGPPGMEDEVREIIRGEAEKYSSKIETDVLGNLIVEFGDPSSRPRVLVAAHMDEVGFMVRFVDKRGFLYVHRVGGVNLEIVPGSRILFETSKGKVLGVAQRRISGKTEDIFIDIGAARREDAHRQGIEIGTMGVFEPCFRTMNTGYRVMGKAFDDRMGCFVALEVMRRIKVEKGHLVYVFTSMEEIGGKGSTVAGYTLEPDYCLVLEGTFALDVPGVPEEDWVNRLGRGPAIRKMDASTVHNVRLFNFFKKVARELNLPYQIQVTRRGGTDASKIEVTRSGVVSGVISVPNRYIHTGVMIADIDDIENTIKLSAGVIDRLLRGTEKITIKSN